MNGFAARLPLTAPVQGLHRSFFVFIQDFVRRP